MKPESCTTVGELAANFPHATRILERAGIDYCCGGKTPVARACADAGLDSAALLAELNAGLQTEVAQEWQTRSLTDLIAHIIGKHHAYVRSELPRIDNLITKVVGVHGARRPELTQVKSAFAELARELSHHMLKEEQILFPYIERMEQAAQNGSEPPEPFFGTVQNPIRMMMQEHTAAGGETALLRRLTSGYAPPDDACISYRTLYSALAEFEADLHQHIHLENNILFPRAIALENRQ
jgi:regulator of cell morphogenesis and NO signaling